MSCEKRTFPYDSRFWHNVTLKLGELRPKKITSETGWIKHISLKSYFSNLRSRGVKFVNSFFGLTQRFKIWILSEVFEALTFPRWFSIYLKKDLLASDENIGIINATQSGVKLLLWLPSGIIGQKMSGKKCLLVNFTVQALAFLIAFFAEDWTWAILISIFLGLRALGYSGAQALIGRITDRATRATVFALEATILSIVIMLRDPIQGYLAETNGLRPLYLLGFIGTMTSCLIFLRFFPDIKREDKLNERQSESKQAENWRTQVHQVLSRHEYRRNFIGLLQAGVISYFFCSSFNPFIEIYLYEQIGWSFLFFGFYGFASSFLTFVLRIPFGKLMDKYRLKRIFVFAGPISAGITALLMVYVKDPYFLSTIFLINSVVDTGYIIAEQTLWYDAIPIEVYSIGVSIRGVVYGFSGMTGSLIGAYIWANLGSFSSFLIKSIAEFSRGLLAVYLIRDIKSKNVRNKDQ